jgi:Uncharacterized protein predicted to be involved in DNA repair (RAMP superfamily)
MSLSRIEDLEVRLYKLTTRSHLSIGAGEGSVELSAVDKPVIRALIYDGIDKEPKRITPYVPASSFHGVLRSWVEKAIKSMNTGQQVTNLSSISNEVKERVKRGLNLDMGATDDQILKEWEELYKDVCNPLVEIDKCEIIQDQEKKWKQEFLEAIGRTIPCRVCKSFGYMGQRGRVRFTHAYPSIDNVKLDIITRVAINRLTGASDEKGKLFDLEAVPPGVEFYLFAILENMDEGMKNDFELGVRAFQVQLAALGAHSNVGFGYVDIDEIFTLKINPGIFDLEIEKNRLRGKVKGWSL